MANGACAKHIAFMCLICCVALWSPCAPAQSAAEKVYEDVRDSIITVYSVDEEKNAKSALGSGVAVTKSLIATNCHVALSGSFLVVKIQNESLLGRLFYYNQKKDFCLIEVSGSPLKFVNIRPSASVKIGEEVFAIGNPEGEMKSISRGIISNKHKLKDMELLQTDASLSHGSSGGGLFDISGNLVGITTASHKTGENIGYAIPTELILDVIGTQNSTQNTDTSDAISAAKANPAAEPTAKNNSDYNKLTRIGYYGEDEVALMKWHGRCFIGIVGRYKDKPSSLAVWFPRAPNGLFIFSQAVNAENAVKFFNQINEQENVQYVESKSFIYFDKKLYPLPIMSIKNVKHPVYTFAMSGEITEELVSLDYFLGQFYRHAQTEGMTTIKFGLGGFTEAFGAYTKHCK